MTKRLALITAAVIESGVASSPCRRSTGGPLQAQQRGFCTPI